MPREFVVEDQGSRQRKVTGLRADGVGVLECRHRRWLAGSERRVGAVVMCQVCDVGSRAKSVRPEGAAA